ncbi:MAG: hypothetical protein QOI66_551 [Myxococcales bacterium]|nr:hypothetical protein [Myxococcales bacterium]
MTTDAGFVTSYRGTLTGTPLYLENGPGGKGAFFVATQANMVYAFDETTGKELWNKSAGTPTAGGCDNMPKGIMGTPAIDPVSRTIFVSAATGGAVFQFKIHAYNVDDGTERAGWPVDIGPAIGLTGPILSRHNQRGSLLLVNGILYVPLGGQFSDCSNARGRVVAINIADPTKIGTWATSDDGGSIWAPGGMASDGTGIFAVTGNHFPNLSAPDTHGDSEEVVRLTGMAQVMRNDANVFYPKRWEAMDIADLDFGANSPLVMDVPGGTPARLIAASPKDGHLYFLDPNNLGGMGGEKFDLVIATQGMSLVAAAPASYVTDKGAYIVMATQGGHCPPGGPTGSVVIGVSVPVVAGAIAPTVAWCASGSGGTFAATSPVVTTTDGKKDAVVWYISGGTLKGVDGDTGAQVFSGGACQVERWTSPIVAKGARIVAGGNGKLCSWSAM